MVFASKIATVLLRTAQLTKTLFGSPSEENCACFFAFRNFTMQQTQLKRHLQADRSLGINKHVRRN